MTTDTTETIRDAMLDQALEEVLDGRDLPDVTDRVLVALARPDADLELARRPPSRLWLAAALWILGIAVVGAVWQLGGRDATAPTKPQDPEPTAPLWRSETAVGALARTAAELRRLPGDTRYLRLVVRRERDVARAAGLGQLERLRLMNTGNEPRVFDGAAFEDIAEVHSLRRIDLSGITPTPAAVRALAALPALTWLQLESGRPTPEAIAALADHRALRVLETRFMPVDDATLAAIAALPITELRLDYAKGATDRGLLAVAAMPGLKALSLRWVKETGDDVIAALAKADRLHALVLDANDYITEKGLAQLGRMSALRSLSLLSMQLSATVLDALPDTLTALDLSDSKGLDRAAVAGLKRIAGLRELRLGRVALTEEDLLGLLHAHRYHTLSLHGCTLTSAVIAALAGQDDLTALHLRGCRFERTDDLQHWLRLRKLRALTLRSPRGLDAGALKTVGQLKTLRSLDLSGWAGLDEGLADLGALPLEDLVLLGTGFDNDDVRDAAEQWPGCRIRMPDEVLGIR